MLLKKYAANLSTDPNLAVAANHPDTLGHVIQAMQSAQAAGMGTDFSDEAIERRAAKCKQDDLAMRGNEDAQIEATAAVHAQALIRIIERRAENTDADV
jgi:hypothetical protein